MNYFSFIVKELVRKKARGLFAILGMTIGVVTCIVMLGLSEGIRDSFSSAYLSRHIDIIVFEKDQYNLLSSRIDASISQELQKYPEIESATGILFDVIKYEKSYLPLHGWPIESRLFKDIKVIGQKPRPHQYEVMLGEVLARTAAKSIGDSVTIKRKPFKVVGIFQSDIPIERSSMVIPLTTMQAMDKKLANSVVGINVTLAQEFKDDISLDNVIKKIEAQHETLSAQPADIFSEEKARMFLIGEKFATLVLIVTVIAVILGLVNTMTTSIFEKKKLIGLLLTLGWQKTDIIVSLFCQALFLSFVSGVLGIIIGFYATEYVYKVSMVNMFAVSWDYQFIINIIAVVMSAVIASVFMASWIVVNMNPLEVIKNE